MHIGESLVGERPNAAHINLYIGLRTGPVGVALASAAAAPRLGYIPFMVVLKPNVPVKPITLFAGKADLRGERHETMNWGPAQIGVAEGVAKALVDGIFPPEAADEWCIIAAVWVAWAADNADAVYRNNRQATYEAAGRAMRSTPSLNDIREALASSGNAFYTPPAAVR
jgi:5,6,7,8-tetrahydromethanopterin hydro-lyase